MRIAILPAILALACLSQPGVAAEPAKQSPWRFSEAEVTTLSGSADGSTLVSRKFLVDRSVLVSGADSSGDPESEPGTTPPGIPDEPDKWVAGDTTSVTITQRGGGYQRDTIYTRTIGKPWIRNSDHLFICQPESMCWPSTVE